MKLYFAPMEGITGCLFRNAYEKVFPGVIDKYFSPFLSSGVRKGIAGKDAKQLAPENNRGIVLVPQLLTNDAKDFETTAEALLKLGYNEINLNFGCPSQTVVSKGRGAGMLADLDRLDRFLEQASDFCRKNGILLSVKTRLGISDTEEFAEVLAVYERYPLSELILHLRLRNDFYKLPCHKQCYDYALQHCSHTLVYNGDISTKAEAEQVMQQYPQTGAVMIGRGLLKNPCMLSEPENKEKLWQFHDILYLAYQEEMSGQRNVLFKMKELWSYLGESFYTGEEEQGRRNQKALKQIRKCRMLGDYEAATDILRTGS